MSTAGCRYDDVTIVVFFARYFRHVFGRLHTDTHHVHAEQPPLSDTDGLISFCIETLISDVCC